jgi:hypothetical protein
LVLTSILWHVGVWHSLLKVDAKDEVLGMYRGTLAQTLKFNPSRKQTGWFPKMMTTELPTAHQRAKLYKANFAAKKASSTAYK